ncbi:ankyrin repeat and protein kinase domain-containing protein 1 isoform X2 [Nelusetta ayraudi]|uniref:ankyrin repeat and protein kinase domain-containing protein 1 isoform X2 n=1 Tax=Nelusetta ayraudi TaxID=303726 RepID=UPI003F6F8993
MDSVGGSMGQFTSFRKDDFEADWTKVAEGRFTQVYQVKLKIWREKCALKSYDLAICPSKFYSMKPPVLHLNLKTSNILLDDHLHVKISDFGLIHWEEGMDTKVFMEDLTAYGNISYTPPETFSKNSDPPGTSFDVYSFGILIWEILTQQKPYAGCSVTTVLLQVSHGKRPNVDMIPEQRPQECNQMISVMKQCWDQEDRKRPPFSDTVKKTEALSDVLKIPGSATCLKVGGVDRQKPNYPWLVSPVDKLELPEMCDPPPGQKHEKENILSLLSKKDFGSFRESVKREHVHTQFSDKMSLLHCTVVSRDAESVEHVLNLGADVNCKTAGGYTPLIIAVLQRLHDIVSLLLERGADTNQTDDDQWTALHFAAQNGDNRAARLLLDKATAVDVQEKVGWTPLHLACQNGHETVARLLLSRQSEEPALGQREAQGRTPLHLAAAYGHMDIVKLLLSQGAKPNVADSSLSTPLHLSAEDGHNRVVRQLLKSGAAVDAANGKGLTSLHLAALRGHTGICRQLLSNQADPELRTTQGWTPMHLAALRGHEATVIQLESQGASVNARGQDGWTPLHLACHQSHAAVAAALLAAKADPDASEDSKGWTPLHVAASSSCFSSVLHLIKCGANVNAANSERATPLHVAARHGSAAVVKALLLNEADRSLRDSSGSTALTVAKESEKLEIVKLLEN